MNKLFPVLVLLLSAMSMAMAQQPAYSDPAAAGVTIREAANLAVGLSPKKDRLLLGLYNMLYTVPVDGGKAQAITDLVFDGFHAAWSPVADEIAVQSYADGQFHIWLITADGKSRRQLTRGPFADSYPAWSPDGKKIAFASTRGATGESGGNDIWLLTVASGELEQLTAGPGDKIGPVWSSDGRQIAYVAGDGGFSEQPVGKIRIVNVADKQIRTPTPDIAGHLAGLAWSPDGKRLSYVKDGKLTLTQLESGEVTQLKQFEDVFPFAAQWLSNDELVYGANGSIVRTALDTGQSRTIPFELTLPLHRKPYKRKQYELTSTRARQVLGIVAPALSPDGKRVVFKALNDLWLLTIGNSKPERLTHDAFYEADPAWSRDGRSIAYSSDKGGTPDIYLLDLTTGRERRVTDSPGSEFGAALSADGQLAFQDQDYRTHVLRLSQDSSPVDAAAERTIGEAALFSTPGRLSWSPDGKKLALASFHSDRNMIGIVDVLSGKSKAVEPAPGDTLTARGDEGPVWSPDGKWLAFTMQGTLWVLPVDGTGEPLAAAKRLTDESAESMSWNGDSSELLYLHHGHLKLISVNGGKPRPVPLDLTWQNAVAATSYLIHVGKVWDGKDPAMQADMDILVKGARVVSLTKHSQAMHERPDLETIDLSNFTAVPGLIDAHFHQQEKIKMLGDRQGRLMLSFGITTTRGTGDPAYQALEDRESLAAGLRLGPRYFMSGEILDGFSAIWSDSRAVVNAQQLDLELQRARALDYDLLKTYANFRHDWQQQAIQWGHEKMGVPLTSHFLYPAAGLGADGVEHMQSGPVRHGINFASNGRVYQDAIELFAKSGIVGCTTIFATAYQYALHPDIVADARVKSFYMPADQQALAERVKCARGGAPCGPFFTPSKTKARDVTLTVKRVLDAGGHVINGTDAPLDEPALSLHNNLRGMAALGLSPFTVLQLTTSKAADAIGVGKDLGTLEPGKLADMIFVSGDPAQNIADLANVHAVMKGGRLYTMEEIIGPFAHRTAPAASTAAP